MTNPVYAGAYAFGRTESRVTVENGRKRVTRGFRRDRAEWDVLIRDHHEGYVSWDEYERNQRLIADNANCRGLMARGAVRRGDALLAGLLRCGHCGRRVACPLQRHQGVLRPLRLPRRACQPRHQAVHRFRRLARGYCGRRCSAATAISARRRSGAGRHRDP